MAEDGEGTAMSRTADDGHEREGGASPAPAAVPSIKPSAWNLLLLVPLFMVFTPVFNSDGPRLGGLPFFYWYQFAWVPVGVVCVGIVFVKTRHR
jgi:hypothetical protein